MGYLHKILCKKNFLCEKGDVITLVDGNSSWLKLYLRARTELGRQSSLIYCGNMWLSLKKIFQVENQEKP